ncbi:BH0509 family protein [Metabacillus arenae]|uniref:BH0509 family protein n=1 Tax=Metabacillus arenae TaxID=2771434 RepID=A0A926NA58_9BACI|nr:BH0509 family protein [Metabacillus arenae]MBD1379619.1 BH0509 family protein [Metabacillus arenae]
MSRQERKNMIEFISTMRKIEKDTLIYMTDAEVEHIYFSTYDHYMEMSGE